MTETRWQSTGRDNGLPNIKRHHEQAAVVAILPMVAIFFGFQNFFVKGITVSGLKG